MHAHYYIPIRYSILTYYYTTAEVNYYIKRKKKLIVFRILINYHIIIGVN